MIELRGSAAYLKIVFLDEKKFLGSEVWDRATKYGYALAGERLPRTYGLHYNLIAILNHSIYEGLSNLKPVYPKIEVIGAISVVQETRPLENDEVGNVGLIALRGDEKKLSIQAILEWSEDMLAPQLNPYPHPRSIVVLDNMPQHRSHQAQLERIINARCSTYLESSQFARSQPN